MAITTSDNRDHRDDSEAAAAHLLEKDSHISLEHQEPRSFLQRLLLTVDLSNRSRNSYGDGPSRAQQRQARRRRRNICFAVLITLAVLFLVLFFGFSLFTSFMASYAPVSPEPTYLPHWGEPGYIGEGLSHYPTDLTRDVIPIPCHSHNDYERRIPLLDAIHHGFTSVEADVWLVDEELLIGHTRSSLAPNRTFRSLYVNPLAKILGRQNPSTKFADGTRHGIFDADPDQPLVLLVDLKTEGYSTLPAVVAQLETLRERDWLTYFNGETVVPGPVTVVLTGETPFDALLANETRRDIFFDAPLDLIWKDSQSRQNDSNKLFAASRIRADQGGQGHSGLSTITSGADFTPHNSYYASVSFAEVFGWPQSRPIGQEQLDIIRSQIAAVHQQGLKVRYWGTPGWPVGLRNSIWKTLVEEGVDTLNVDDLDAAAYGDWTKSSWWS